MLPEAASGLRPAALFVGFAVALGVVLARAAWIHAFAPGAQPEVNFSSESPLGGFTIADREGRPLAVSVECFDVTVSPRALWRSHTPERLAEKIAGVLGKARTSREDVARLAQPREILRRTLPAELETSPLAGRLVPSEPRLLFFEGARVDSVRAWLESGAVGDREPKGPIRGLGLVRLGTDEAAPYTLAMDPVACLGRSARVDQFGEWPGKDGELRTATPERWTRRLLADLLSLVGRDEALARLDRDTQRVLGALAPADADERLLDALWAEFVPSRFRVVARAIDPLTAHALRDLMTEEAVSRFQLQLVPRVERRHPTRPGGLATAPSIQDGLANSVALAGDDDAFTLLGHWGHLDEERAEARAERDLTERPHVLPWEGDEDPFDAYRRSLVVDRRPWSGIELLCQTELENGDWAPLVADLHGRAYERRVRHLARDRRREFTGKVPNYFGATAEASVEPTLNATLDARLQEVLHRELGDLMEEHVPALAMGIVVDVDTGDVLALDARTLYGYSGYAPLLHEFTPGSTFKAVVMASALDAGVVTPDDVFETHAPGGILLRHGRSSRRIREAEGAPNAAWISAAEGLAHSCNAVLVQIALRFEAPELRERLARLGYGTAPVAGLGPERGGYLPPLDARGSWNRLHTHASVGFGHELTVTLWQHAAALATILRGGTHRPLRLLRSVEAGGEVLERPLGGGERVLSERACDQVRTMLALGAEIGTGRHVARRDQHPEFDWIGTKTGTTEKVETELCVHLELEALAAAALEGRRWTRSDREALKRLAKPHGKPTCYTSSMVASARGTFDGVERNLMVLIVADDPSGTERFGSRVTGPTAIAVLRQSFGLERNHAGDARERAAARQKPAEPVQARAAAAPRGPVLFDAALRDPRRASGAAGRAYDASWLDQDTPWVPPLDFADDDARARGDKR